MEGWKKRSGLMEAKGDEEERKREGGKREEGEEKTREVLTVVPLCR